MAHSPDQKSFDESCQKFWHSYYEGTRQEAESALSVLRGAYADIRNKNIRNKNLNNKNDLAEAEQYMGRQS